MSRYVLIASTLAALVIAAALPRRAAAQYERLPSPLPPTVNEVYPDTIYLDELGRPAAPYSYPAVPQPYGQPWTWQLMPEGLIYRAYLAGIKESRLSSTWVSERRSGGQWESTLGGRVGLLRYGTQDAFWPEGWQLDVEAAAFPRLDLEEHRDLDAADFRAGVPLTWRRGVLEAKFAYYHLSAHAGDEFLIKNPDFERINFSRDVLVLGAAIRPTVNTRFYAEAGWSFYTDISEPWEFQFGAEYAPREPTGWRGGPFLAVNGHLREEVDFGGNVVVETGWAWRSAEVGRLFRAGFQYVNGKSRQFQFFDQFEEQIGGGIWYDY